MALRQALVDEEMIAQRERLGIDHRDEVWEGFYVMVPPARQPHQRISFLIARALDRLGLAEVDLEVGVGHKDDYRVPDVTLYDADEVDDQLLYIARARLVVEVISPSEDPHAKLGFYAQRSDEVLLVLPERLELFVRDRPVSPEPAEGWLVGRTVAARVDPADGALLLALPDRSVVERIPRP